MNRKKISSIFVLTLVIILTPFFVLPLTAAENSKIPATELSQKTSEVLAVLHDEPDGGKVITKQELDALLNSYRNKMAISHPDTNYSKSMSGDFVKKDGNWALGKNVSLYETWFNQTSALTEMLFIASSYSPANVGTINVTLTKNDDNFTYVYTWIKTAKIGNFSKIPKTEMPPGRPEEAPEMTITLYADQTIDGELCKVYSINILNSQQII